MLLELSLAIPWFAAVLVALLDGRREWVGWLAAVALAATIACNAVVGWDVHHHGSRIIVAGGWEPGVGINLRADMLDVTFSLLSLGVLLAALVFEVLSGVRSRSFPALVLFLA